MDINKSLKDVSENIPHIMDKLSEHLEWLAIELEDYEDGEITVSEDYINECSKIIFNTKVELNLLLKTMIKQINNLPE